jgi:hypothetical protein
VAGTYESRNEPSSSKKCGEFFYYFRTGGWVDGWMDTEGEFFRRTPPKGEDVCMLKSEWESLICLHAL